MKQALEALQVANDTRIERLRLRMQVKEGAISAIDLLLDPPKVVWGLTVFGLLKWQPRWGEDRARRVLSDLGIPELKTLGPARPQRRAELPLSYQQREALCEVLRKKNA